MTNLTLAARRRSPLRGRRSRGLSLVELMVALGLGLVLVIGVASVYLFTKTAFGRQSQLSNLQQSVRTAFEYLGNDARMVGHLGCSTGSATALLNDLSISAVATNFAVGVEGYEYTNTTVGTYNLGSDNPADSTAASEWTINTPTTGPSTINTLPMTALGSALTPGSDVLVIRTVTGEPLRLTANAVAAGSPIEIESVSGGTCKDGITTKVSGFCPGSYGLIANCGAARAFRVNSILGGKILTASGAYPEFGLATTEVFPLQTIVYYVKRSASGTTTSLYRRVFSGDNTVAGADPIEQELIEDVESMQIRYGRDTINTDPGAVDRYDTAENVSDWSRVVTIRMSLLMRSATPVTGDTKVPTSAPVNGVTITFPTGSRYDRRVFTTTVALRNRIAYFPPSP